MLLEALICDGDPNRSARFDIFNPLHNVIGIHTGDHSTEKKVTCIVYCGWFTKNGEESILQKKMLEF
jgi:hypothetical protein